MFSADVPYHLDHHGKRIAVENLLLCADLTKYCSAQLLGYDLSYETEKIASKDWSSDKKHSELRLYSSMYKANLSFLDSHGTDYEAFEGADVALWALRSYANLLELRALLKHLFKHFSGSIPGVEEGLQAVAHAAACSDVFFTAARGHILGRGWMQEPRTVIQYDEQDLLLREASTSWDLALEKRAYDAWHKALQDGADPGEWRKIR